MPTLNLSRASTAGNTYDLAALGSTDWFVYPGLAGSPRTTKIGTPVLADTLISGTAAGTAFNGTTSTLTWTGGTPTAAGSTTGGIYTGTAAGQGFTVTAPAGTATRTLRIYAGCFQSTLKVTAHLSDGSVADAVDTSLTHTGSGNAAMSEYTITYSAATDGQTLTVSLTNNAGGGNLNIQGAALAVAVVVTAPDAPTGTTASAGNGSATVTGTAPASNGGSPITGYRATSTPGGITGTSTTLPVNVSGLTNGVAYTFTLAAQNSVGYGPESPASNSVTPSNVNNPPTFPGGNIPNITGSAGSAISPVNVSSLFADSDALTYSASPAGTAWPSGLSINPTTGVISGTVTAAGTTTGLRVRATDTASQTVDSNAFNVTIGTGPVQVAITDPDVFWSPYTWDDRTTYKSANSCGSYVKLAFTGTSVAAKIDVSHMVAASLPAGQYPIVRMLIDGKTATDTQLTSSTTALTVSGLAAGAHTLELSFNAAYTTVPDRWTTPVSSVRITGFTLDQGASLQAQSLRTKRAIYYGDSITEGYLSYGNGQQQPVGNSAANTAVPLIMRSLDAEYGQVGYGAQGYAVNGQGNVPNFNAAYGLYSSGRTRLVAGKFSPEPDYVFVEHGANGGASQADVATAITNLRAAAPNARIFVMVPAGGFARSAITAAVTASGDVKVHVVDLGTSYQAGIESYGAASIWSQDGLHRNTLSNAHVAAGYVRKVQAVLDGVSVPNLTPRTVTVSLATGLDANGQPAPAANLTGLKVAFHDEAGPDAVTVPRFQSSSETTDGNGVLTFIANSTLAAGGTGHLTVLGAANVHFNGPVQVT